MTTPPPPHQVQPNGAPHALGDLLSGHAAAPEKDWIELLEAIAAREVRALHALYERTHHLVFTLAIRITNNRDAAEEITLDVFNDVWRRASTYDPASGAVVGWILNETRSRSLDRLQMGHSPLDPATAPDDGAALRVQGGLLREALTVLTPAERQAIETTFFSELTSQEVAARPDEAPETTKTHVRSALQTLRQALAKTVKGP